MDKPTRPVPKEEKKIVLLTGGSGLIGKPLTSTLLKKGYTVHHLVRAGSERLPGVKSFTWDIYGREIDPECIKGVSAIIHLAGEPVAARAWTLKRKQQIIESRTESIRLIYGLLKTGKHRVRSVISASAAGYYGDCGAEWLPEKHPAGNDFLAHCCFEWEKAVDEAPPGVRVVKLRTGIVLHKEDGALKPIAATIRAGVGAPLGSGKQWMPWIHHSDVTELYLLALENDEISGVYNMVSPNPVTNREFTRTLASILKKPLWLPRVPGFVLRILMGKMSMVALQSTRLSADKVGSAGFRFKFPQLEAALKEIYG